MTQVAQALRKRFVPPKLPMYEKDSICLVCLQSCEEEACEDHGASYMTIMWTNRRHRPDLSHMTPLVLDLEHTGSN